jgi:phosphoglycerol geranylgeranyltransferase
LLELGPTETRIHKLLEKKHPLLAALIDPEEFTPAEAQETAKAAEKAGASLFLVGGSTLTDQSRLDRVVRMIKHHVTSPVVLFPNNITGISRYADAILFSTLLNSTNSYFLMGAQALGSMKVYKTHLETIPMGYLVFGNSSSTSFIGQVQTLQTSRSGIAVIYALAAKYLGMRTLYLEGGSGTGDPVAPYTIKYIKKYYEGLLFVGGGIRSPEKAREIAEAGADIIVVGNLLQAPGFEKTLAEIASTIKLKK